MPVTPPVPSQQSNPYDQFDEKPEPNPYDQFDPQQNYLADKARRFGREVPKQIGDVVASPGSALQSAAELHAEAMRWRAVRSGDLTEAEAAAKKQEFLDRAGQTAPMQAAQAIRDVGADLGQVGTRHIAQPDPARDAEIGSAVATGAASLAPLLAAGAVAPIAAIPAAAGMMGEQQRQDAAEKGATPTQQAAAFMVGAPVGAASEALLGVPALLGSVRGAKAVADMLGKAAGGLDTMMAGLFAKMAPSIVPVAQQAVKSAVREGVQEGLEQIAQNTIAKDVVGYNPTRDRTEGAGMAMLAGSIVGGGVGAGHQAAYELAKPAAQRDVQTSQPAQIPAAQRDLEAALAAQPKPPAAPTEPVGNFVTDLLAKGAAATAAEREARAKEESARTERQKELDEKKTRFDERLAVARETLADPTAPFERVKGALESISSYADDNALGLTQTQREQALAAQAALAQRHEQLKPAAEAAADAAAESRRTEAKLAADAKQEKVRREQAALQHLETTGRDLATGDITDLRYVPDEELASLNPEAEGLTAQQIDAEIQRRGEEAERAAATGSDAGYTLRDLILGKRAALAAAGQRAPLRLKSPAALSLEGGTMAGEHRAIGERQGGFRIFADNGLAEDRLQERLQELGFNAPDVGTAYDLYERALGGEEIRPERAGENQVEFAQAPQTDSPEFKTWFGNSKITDKEGRPLIVYHGTDTRFTTFEQTSDIGYHFGTRAAARTMGRHLMPAFLRIENPIRLPDLGTWGLFDVMRNIPRSILTSKEVDEIGTIHQTGYAGQSDELLIAKLRAKGYDGFTYENAIEDKGTMSYIAFEPTQIKSATTNRGTFDPADPRIDHATTPTTEPAPRATLTDADVNQRLEQIRREFPALTRDVDIRSGLVADELKNAGYNDKVPAGVQAAIYHLDAEKRLLVIAAQAARSNQGAGLFLHEMAHPFFDSLPTETKTILRELHAQEMRTKTGPLFDAAGQLTTDVFVRADQFSAARLAADPDLPIKEWFAERVRALNADWLAGRIPRDHSTLVRVWRELIAKLRAIFARVRGLDTDSDLFTETFRRWLDTGARADLTRTGLAYAQRKRAEFAETRGSQKENPVSVSPPDLLNQTSGLDSSSTSVLNQLFQSAPRSENRGDGSQLAEMRSAAQAQTSARLKNLETQINELLSAIRTITEKDRLRRNQWQDQHGSFASIQEMRQWFNDPKMELAHVMIKEAGKNERLVGRNVEMSRGVVTYMEPLQEFLARTKTLGPISGFAFGSPFTGGYGTARFSSTGALKHVLDGETHLASADGFTYTPFPKSDEIETAHAKLADLQAKKFVLAEEEDGRTSRLEAKQSAAEWARKTRASEFAALLDARDEAVAKHAQTFTARVWEAFGKNDEVFQNGRTDSPDAAEIAKAVSGPGRAVTVYDGRKAGRDYLIFTGREGTIEIHDADTARPYIRSTNAKSQGKQSGGGSQLYMAALDWIHNNGKRIKDDAGLTSINAIRRTSNFLASAIRWGTTKHLKPHADQGMKWTKSDALNVSALAAKEMANAFNAVAEARSWRYDFTSGEFRDSQNQRLTRERFETAVRVGNPAQSGVGLSTLQRAVITHSAIEAFARGETETNVLGAAERGVVPAGVLYAQGPEADPKTRLAAIEQRLADLSNSQEDAADIEARGRALTAERDQLRRDIAAEERTATTAAALTPLDTRHPLAVATPEPGDAWTMAPKMTDGELAAERERVTTHVHDNFAGLAPAERAALGARVQALTAEQIRRGLPTGATVTPIPKVDRRAALLAELARGRALRDEGDRTGNHAANAEGVRLVRLATDTLDAEFPGWDKTPPKTKAAAIAELKKWIEARAESYRGKLFGNDRDSRLKQVARDIREGNMPAELASDARELLGATKDAETGETLDASHPDWPRTATLLNFLEGAEIDPDQNDATPEPPPAEAAPANEGDGEQSPFSGAEEDTMPVRRGKWNEVYGHSAYQPSFLARSWRKVRAVLTGIKGPIPELPTFPAAWWNRADSFIREQGAQFYARVSEGERALKSANDYIQRTAEEQLGQIITPLLNQGEKFNAEDYARLQSSQEKARRAQAEGRPVPPGIAAEITALNSKMESSPYVLFNRLVFALDLHWRAQNLKDDRGSAITLPAGINAAETKAEVDRLAQTIAAGPHAALIKRAVEQHMALVQQVAADLKSRELLAADHLANPYYFPHLTLEKRGEGGKIEQRELTPARVRPGTEADFRGYLETPVGSTKAIEQDYVRAMYYHLVQVGAHNFKADAVRDYFRPYDIKATVEARAKELSKQRGRPVSWEMAFNEEFAPRGYVKYGTDSRDAFPTLTVNRDALARRLGVMLSSEDIHRQLAALDQKGIRLLPEDIRETLSQGERETWIVPARVAEALRGIGDRLSKQDNALEAAAKFTLGIWKGWKLFMPWNHVRYEYGNVVADIEKLLSSSPGTFKQLPNAAKELRAFWTGGEPSADLRAALKEGVINAITAQEMDTLTRLKAFEAFQTRSQKAWDMFKRRGSSIVYQPATSALGLGDFSSPELSALREAITRYAKFKNDLTAIRAGARPDYAGAYWKNIEAMTDSRPGAGDAAVRKAAAISKATFGDYGDLSVLGQTARDRFVPFYSWMEINFRYHANLLRNLRDMVQAGEMPAPAAAGKAAKTLTITAAGLGARTAGAIALRLALPYMAVFLWNNSGDRDELEKLLSEEDRRRFHIILGRDAEGKVLVAYGNTALMDVMKWFGGPKFAAAMGQWYAGKTDFTTAVGTWKDKLGPDLLNNTAGSVGPGFKIPYALAAKKATFPDITDQRSIPAYDMRRHILGQITDEFTADAIERTINKDYYGSKDLTGWAKQLILQVRQRDPESWAFYAIKDKANDYLEKRTGTKRDNAFDAPDQQVLRNFRRAIYRGDADMAVQFYQRLLDYGYTAERFQSSIRSQDPLAALPKQNGLREQFVASLSPDDRALLDRAYAYYQRMSSSKGRERQLFPPKASGLNGQMRYQAQPRTEQLRAMMERTEGMSEDEIRARGLRDERRSLQRTR